MDRTLKVLRSGCTNDDLDSGHGTHVAGSVLGDGSSSHGLSGTEGPIRDLAHGAKLVFQAIEQEMKWEDPRYYDSIGRYLLSGIPDDISNIGEAGAVCDNAQGFGRLDLDGAVAPQAS